MPARNITTEPEKATRTAVPRSGCITMSPVGMRTTRNASMTYENLIGIERFVMNAATAIGMITLRNSEGWNFTMPRSSQRLAPMFTVPNFHTRIRSSTHPA